MGFAPPSEPWYRPVVGRRDRLSLALWPPGPDPASPEFVQVDGRVVAVVIVWPTDENGMLTEASDLDKARVLPWVVSDEALARLAEVHGTWHLAQHDLWVCGDTITPCPRSLMRPMAEHPGPLRRHATQLREDLLQGLA